MTEAIVNNIIQSSNKDFFSPGKENLESGHSKSFAKTMREINSQPQKRKTYSAREPISSQNKKAKLDEKGFFKKLKKVLQKDSTKVPSELLSMLQNVNLNREQRAMLGQLMLNLQNNNLSISDLKSLLKKNSNRLNLEESSLQYLFNETEGNKELSFQSLNIEDLEKLSYLMKNGIVKLSEKENSELKSEINKLSQILSNLDSRKLKSNLNQTKAADNADSSLEHLISVLKSVDLESDSLGQISRLENLETPVLSSLLDQDNSALSESVNMVTSGDGESLFAELSVQLEEMLKQQDSQSSANNSAAKTDLLNSELFSLNSDLSSVFDSAGKLENQNNFFDLDNSNLLFNFGQENQNLNGSVNTEQFSLNNENRAQLAESADLRSQVVEQFKGEYSPETKEMQIQLKPESLGKIDISLSYDNQELTGKMLVESELVRAQLENSLKGLKSDLLKQGINIEQFKIETAKNGPQQVDKQENFVFDQQNSGFSDGETGQNQEYEQRQFFQGQYYVRRHNGSPDLDNDSLVMRQQEIINRAAFSNEKLNLLA